jgi:hypothetical protein
MTFSMIVAGFACSGDDAEDLTITPLTSVDHFRLTEEISVSTDSPRESFEQTVIVLFQSPDSWEIIAEDAESFPGHVVIVEDEAWREEQGSWAEADADFWHSTALAFVNAFEGLSKVKPAQKKAGPITAGEETTVALYKNESLGKMMGNGGVTNELKDVKGIWEVIVGVDSGRIYSVQMNAKGNDYESSLIFSFDYVSPVNIESPD